MRGLGDLKTRVRSLLPHKATNQTKTKSPHRAQTLFATAKLDETHLNNVKD
jgi:hypothetical protein